MKVREIIKPEVVTVNSQKVDFSNLVLETVSDARFLTDYASLSNAAKIYHASKASRFLIDEDVWAFYCDVIRHPTKPYASYMIALVSYLDAILNAKLPAEKPIAVDVRPALDASDAELSEPKPHQA